LIDWIKIHHQTTQNHYPQRNGKNFTSYPVKTASLKISHNRPPLLHYLASQSHNKSQKNHQKHKKPMNFSGEIVDH